MQIPLRDSCLRAACSRFQNLPYVLNESRSRTAIVDSFNFALRIKYHRSENAGAPRLSFTTSLLNHAGWFPKAWHWQLSIRFGRGEKQLAAAPTRTWTAHKTRDESDFSK
jgi:hypothetical protein